MLAKLSKKLTSFFVCKKYIQEDSTEIYEYCFEILLSTFINLCGLLIVSLILKTYFATLIFSIVFMTIRNYAGGFHAKRHSSCFFLLILIHDGMTKIFYIPLILLKKLSLASLTFSFISYMILAPVESINKPLTKDEHCKLKRKTTIATLLFITTSSILLRFEITCQYGIIISYVLFVCSLLLYLGKFSNMLMRNKIVLSIDD